MSARCTVKLKTATLLALVLFLVHAACQVNQMTSQVGMPSVEGQDQNDITSLDVGNDGVDATDPQTTTAMGATPIQVSRSEALGFVVTKELNVDADTLSVTCIHDLLAGSATTSECIGVSRAVFPIERESGPAEFDALIFTSSPHSGAPELTEQMEVRVVIDCGGLIEVRDLSLTTVQQDLIAAEVGTGASECAVVVTMTNSRVVSTGLATRVIQGVQVTARNLAPIDCTNGADCPLGLPLCNPSGFCQSGLEGQECAIAALHCSTPFCNGTQCADGDGGSTAGGPHACADGYTFDVDQCEGEPCATGADCPPERPICTADGGCSATGVRSDGCLQNAGCESNLCVASVCNELLGQGEDCSLLDTICGAGLICFANGTCQVALPLGEACNANDECEDGPPGINSCIDGVCSQRGDGGDICDPGDDLDCLPGSFCEATNTCS